MNLINYSSIYGLSAGLCFALISLPDISISILKRLKKALDRISEDVTRASSDHQIVLDQLQQVLYVSKGIKHLTYLERNELIEVRKENREHVDWCSTKKAQYKTFLITRNLNAILLALYTYCLLFNGSMLIAAGFQADCVIKSTQTENFIFSIDLISILSLFML